MIPERPDQKEFKHDHRKNQIQSTNQEPLPIITILFSLASTSKPQRRPLSVPFHQPQGENILTENNEIPVHQQPLTAEQEALSNVIGQLLAAQKIFDYPDEKEPKAMIGFP